MHRDPKMKVRVREEKKGNRVPGNEQVRREIQTFLVALASYPDGFAANPRITFEEHCKSLILSARGVPPPFQDQCQ